MIGKEILFRFIFESRLTNKPPGLSFPFFSHCWAVLFPPLPRTEERGRGQLSGKLQ